MARYWPLMVAAADMVIGLVLFVTWRPVEAIFMAVMALCFMVFQLVKAVDEWTL